MIFGVSDIKGIIKNSGNVVIDYNTLTFGVSDLKALAKEAKSNNVTFTIRNAFKIGKSDLKAIAKSGEGAVIIELCSSNVKD